MAPRRGSEALVSNRVQFTWDRSAAQSHTVQAGMQGITLTSMLQLKCKLEDAEQTVMAGRSAAQGRDAEQQEQQPALSKHVLRCGNYFWNPFICCVVVAWL